jgi:holo-[acyl-carrier protein] synthase
MNNSVGIDFVQVKRIKSSLDKFGEHFLKRIFTQEEVEYCQKKKKPEIHLAARFAAKEATMKALGTGWSSGIKWTDIKIKNNEKGKPEIQLEGKAQELLQNRKIVVSLSHTDEYAVAVVNIFE